MVRDWSSLERVLCGDEEEVSWKRVVRKWSVLL